MPDPDPQRATRCPICHRAIPPGAPARLRPFCSTRCADVDLGRWFGGGYVIPGPPAELDDDPPDSIS